MISKGSCRSLYKKTEFHGFRLYLKITTIIFQEKEACFIRKHFIFLATALILLCNITVIHAASYSGTCGNEAVEWALDENGVLTISGNGDLWWEEDTSPWSAHLSEITQVVVESGIFSICDNAFAGCTALETP